MADTYLHGAYGNLGESITQRVTASATVPVYFGTAPVGLVRGYGDLDVVNVPVRISSLADARAKVGYSTDFGSFTLCEAIAAHFDSGADGVGPIYVVNVLDPAVHKSAAATEKAVSFVAGRAEVATDTAVIDTVAVKDSAGSTTYAEGTDYALDYNATAGKIVITAVEGGQIEDGEAKVTYTEMDPDAVDAEDVIGTVTTDGQYSGIQALALLFLLLGHRLDRRGQALHGRCQIIDLVHLFFRVRDPVVDPLVLVLHALYKFIMLLPAYVVFH